MGLSKNPDFISTTALRSGVSRQSAQRMLAKQFYVPGLTGDGIPCGLAYLSSICGAAKFFPRLAYDSAWSSAHSGSVSPCGAFGRTLNF